MASIGTHAPNPDDLDMVCLSLAGDDGRVLWGNAAGRALGRAQSPAALFLTDLVHDDDEPIIKDLLEKARRRGHAGRIVRLRDAQSGPRFLHLKLFRRQDSASPDEVPTQGAGGTLVAQGWDVTDLVLRQTESETHALRDPLMRRAQLVGVDDTVE